MKLCLVLEDQPLVLPTEQNLENIYIAQDTLAVYHGFACSESRLDGTEQVIEMQQEVDLPLFATDAIVYLNGSKYGYLNSDHHVTGFGAVIHDIDVSNSSENGAKKISWKAAGVLSDDNFDDSYQFCYYYTVLSWNSDIIDINIDQDDGECSTGDTLNVNFFLADNKGSSTALSNFRTFLHGDNYTQETNVGVLPRGYGFKWSNCKDHHLMQVAYNMGAPRVFIHGGNYRKGSQGIMSPLQNNTSQVDSGFVSWNTSTIFKDNDGRRDYDFLELVTGLSGKEIGFINPPYSILPRNEISNCIGGVISTQEFIIKNIPYAFAMPVLTGWNIGYTCEDEHIKNVGIWIEDWDYSTDSVTKKGTLRYTLAGEFNDKSKNDGNELSHNVSILGLKDIQAGGSAARGMIDLVPFSPLGQAPVSFCRLEQGGKKLRVTVKNTGDDVCPPTKTKVAFGGTTMILDTPEIAPSKTADLLFDVPPNCFNPDCDFIITVDFGNRIDEGNKENNNTTLGICIG